ncbi:MAG: sulfotransferase, partial [Rhodobacterales bacterium]|nr:sulfotransferase [Rhodobacterales bacterium]
LRGLYRAAAATVLGGDLAPGRKIVDKMPLNLVDAGLIHRLFPEARFLFVLRHPADACLSCFMQDFRANRALVHFDTLEGTVALYDRVMDLWRHFRRVLDLDVQTLRYEDLVAHPEATARLLLEDLDLPWTDAVLDHTEKAGAPVRAPSYHQVAEPLYARAVDRWRRYAPHLGDALDPLVPHARAFGYDMDLSE